MSPYLFIAGLIALMLSAVTGYSIGGKHMRNAMIAQQKTATDALIKQHNEDTVQDMLAAAEVERDKARHRAADLDRRNQLDADLKRAPAPATCVMDDVSLKLLHDSIAAANDDQGSPSAQLPDGLRGLKPPAERGVRLNPQVSQPSH